MSKPLIATAVAAVLLTAATFTADAAPVRLLPAEAGQAAEPAEASIVEIHDRRYDRGPRDHWDRDRGRRHGWRDDQGRRHGARWDRLGPRQVTHVLYRYGYRDVGRIYDRGRFYVVVASARHGRPVQLSVDAYTGQIISQAYVVDRPSRGGWGHSWR